MKISHIWVLLRIKGAWLVIWGSNELGGRAWIDIHYRNFVGSGGWTVDELILSFSWAPGVVIFIFRR